MKGAVLLVLVLSCVGVVLGASSFSDDQLSPQLSLVSINSPEFLQLAGKAGKGGPICDEEKGLACPVDGGVCCSTSSCCRHTCLNDLGKCGPSKEQQALQIAQARMKFEGQLTIRGEEVGKEKAKESKAREAALEALKQQEEETKTSEVGSEEASKTEGSASEQAGKEAALALQTAAIKKVQEEAEESANKQVEAQEQEGKANEAKLNEKINAAKAEALKAKLEAEKAKAEALKAKEDAERELQAAQAKRRRN